MYIFSRKEKTPELNSIVEFLNTVPIGSVLIAGIGGFVVYQIGSVILDATLKLGIAIGVVALFYEPVQKKLLHYIAPVISKIAEN